MRLIVAKGVLIPRPETELLALWALERLKAMPGETLNVLDLCTGSGCLALYIAAKEPRAKVTAVELSPEALAIAKRNAESLKLSERIQFIEGDLFAPVDPASREQWDLIVSNPPYIDPAQRETLQPEVRDHEPALALFADDHGLAVLRRIVSESAAWLKAGGRLGVEFGFGQHASVLQMAESAAFASCEIVMDSNKVQRFLYTQKAEMVAK
jgi:release factor glutamine methyltransferase